MEKQPPVVFKIRKIPYQAIGGVLLLVICGWLGYNLYLNRSFQRIKKERGSPPIAIKLLAKGRFIAGMGSNLTQLTLNNDFDRPRWYLFPLILGDSLPSTGMFYTINGEPFTEVRKYPVEKSRLRVVDFRFYGQDSPYNSFLGFCLPPQSTLIIANYPLIMHEKALGQHVEAWEVEFLFTNGHISFEEWLPTELLSSGNVRLLKKARAIGTSNKSYILESQNPAKKDSKRRSQEQDLLPKRKVTYLRARGIRKLSVKIELK